MITMVDKVPDNSSTQVRVITQSPAESVLDRIIPLGFPVAVNRVELGLPTEIFYRLKHSPERTRPRRILAAAHHSRHLEKSELHDQALLAGLACGDTTIAAAPIIILEMDCSKCLKKLWMPQ